MDPGVDAVLPEDRAAPQAAFGFALGTLAEAARGFRHMGTVRAAIRARQKLRVLMDGAPRTLRPLRLDYWGRVWTVAAWDEGAGAFALLRLDRMEEVAALPELFDPEPGRTLADLQAALG